MTNGQLLSFLENNAKHYREKCEDRLNRNKHMNELEGNAKVDIKLVDAILVDFINSIGANLGVDLALYTKDLKNGTIIVHG